VRVRAKETVQLSDRLAMAFAALFFALPTAFLLLVIIDVTLLSPFNAVLGWEWAAGVAAALVILGFCAPKLLAETLGRLWEGMLAFIRWFFV
jgi:hypothetical protein